MFKIALIAFVSVASIGPTNLYAIKEGLRKGFWVIFSIIMGGVLVDILYANLAFHGVAYVVPNILFKSIILFIGGSIFIYLGIKQLKILLESKNKEKIPNNKKFALPLLTGIVMTLPNPFAILIWISLFSEKNYNYNIFKASLLILLVGLFWATIEGILIVMLSKHLREKFIKVIEMLTTLLLIYFGIRFYLNFILLIY